MSIFPQAKNEASQGESEQAFAEQAFVTVAKADLDLLWHLVATNYRQITNIPARQELLLLSAKISNMTKPVSY